MKAFDDLGVLKIRNYEEACKYLQRKYDSLGFSRENYYTISSKGKLIKNDKVGQGAKGLQYHHMCENKVPGLSSPQIARNNSIEYQEASNMCYCNLIEHMWLHILIAENNFDVSDIEEGVITGLGGVRWMVIAINSILSNPTKSWYSREKFKGTGIAEEDIKGMNYNYSNIIINHKSEYLSIINKFCNSPFIRIRFNKTPEELIHAICIACKADTSVTKIYREIEKDVLEDNKSYLEEHNLQAYIDLEKYMNSSNSALVYICTGGGKTTTALEYLRVHDCKALVLGPSTVMEDSWLRKDVNGNIHKFNEDHIDYMNFQSYQNCYRSIDYSRYDLIICDEAHHLDSADRWSEGLRYLIKHNHKIKIIGLTATPTKEQLNGTDNIFKGNICYGLDLVEGLKQNKIWNFSYISAIYGIADLKGEFDRYGEPGKLLYRKLLLEYNKNPIENILRDNMPGGRRKIIVFCASKKDQDEAENIMHTYNPDLEIRRINSDQVKSYIRETKEWFNNTKDKDVCLITVDMVNEGAHYDGINTLVCLRRTNSSRLYLQQLGRLIVLKNKVREDPNCIVFDLTNNAENLIVNSTTLHIKLDADETLIEDKEEEEEKSAEKTIENIKETLKEVDEKDETCIKICKDYTENCVRVLNELKTVSNTSSTINKISNAFVNITNVKENTLIDFKDYLNMDKWEELAVSSKNKRESSTTNIERHSNAPHVRGKKNSTPPKSKAVNAPAQDMEKFATAVCCALKRAYNNKTIYFEDNIEFNDSERNFRVVVKNQSGLNKILYQLGFFKPDVIVELFNNLGSTFCFLQATKLD